MGAQEIRNLKLQAGIPKQKKYYQISKISKKRQRQIAQDDRPEDVRLDEWFLERRKEMVGVCQCGCASKSSKKEDDFYRASICHLFPKAYFKSVSTHPLNWVELNFWNGCHANFDQKGVEKWPGMACWDDIKAKVIVMEPYLTPEEKGRKFCQRLLELVHSTE